MTLKHKTDMIDSSENDLKSFELKVEEIKSKIENSIELRASFKLQSLSESVQSITSENIQIQKEIDQLMDNKEELLENAEKANFAVDVNCLGR